MARHLADPLVEAPVKVTKIDSRNPLNKHVILIVTLLAVVVQVVAEWATTGEPWTALPGVLITALGGWYAKNNTWSNAAVASILDAVFKCETCDARENLDKDEVDFAIEDVLNGTDIGLYETPEIEGGNTLEGN